RGAHEHPGRTGRVRGRLRGRADHAGGGAPAGVERRRGRRGRRPRRVPRAPRAAGALAPQGDGARMSAPPLTVAFLGTGGMGGPRARTIARAGLTVRAWNRTAERARPLENDGATVVERAEDAVEGADVAVTMLSDADATIDVADTLLPALGPDAIWVQAGTIGIDPIEHCIDLAERAGRTIIDAPVLGTLKPAQDGKLTVLASGPDDAIDR